MAYSSLEIANEFLQRALDSKSKLTQMQLQKLDYLAHGYYLASEDDSLIEDPVEAWDYGTVFPKLRDATKRYGREPVSELIRWGDEQFILSVNKNHRKLALATGLRLPEKRILDKVWKIYGAYPAFKLSALTHDDEGPWKKVFIPGENRVIPNKYIKQYFKRIQQQDERDTPAGW